MTLNVVNFAKTSHVYSGAVLSECGTFRYRLWRIWNPEKPRAMWVMLNPSTADASRDDPTIRKCMEFAKRWGCGGIEVVNLYAYRSSSPRALASAGYQVGPKNVETLRAMLSDLLNHVGPVVAAWGTHAAPMHGDWFRVEADNAGRTLHYLRLNKDGSPGHPLYIPYETKLTEWRPPR